MRKHLSPAMIIALIALFFALTGGAFAAQRYIITSTKQIKPSVLTQLRGKTGPKGAQGPTGPRRATGSCWPNGTDRVAGGRGQATDRRAAGCSGATGRRVFPVPA